MIAWLYLHSSWKFCDLLFVLSASQFKIIPKFPNNKIPIIPKFVSEAKWWRDVKFLKSANLTHHKLQFSDDIRAHQKFHCKMEDNKFVFLKREKAVFACQIWHSFVKMIFYPAFWTGQLILMISFISIWFSINFISKHVFLKECDRNETVEQVLHIHFNHWY